MKIELIPTNKLKLNPDNPREITKKAFDSLKKSLKECPDLFKARPLLISNRTGEFVILAGNMRYRAAQKFGYKEMPCIIMPGLTEVQEKEIAIKDNGAWGEWDWDALANAWSDLPLKDWGVDIPMDWQKENNEIQDIEPQIDRAAELNKKWKVKIGDLFRIGNHRLLCGNSTKCEDVKRIVNEEKVFVFSDPPYGISIVNTRGFIGGSGGKAFGKGKIVLAHTFHPIIGDDTTATAEKFYKICFNVGMNDFILWGGNYFTTFLPASPCWLIWDKREDIPSNNFADCEIAWTSFDKPSRIYRHLWSGLLRKGNRKDELIGRVHPSQKPVGLAVNIMQDFPADIYFDGFLGSGSFMIAAQNIDKRMYGIEMDNSYCAVILQRMTDAFPGIEIKKIEK